MEKIYSFGQWIDDTTPRPVPQPRRSGLETGYGVGYHNPVIGGNGTVRMHVGKGCARSGKGACPHCRFDYGEHSVKYHSEGGTTGKSGRVLRPAGGVSSVSKASSGRLKQ